MIWKFLRGVNNVRTSNKLIIIDAYNLIRSLLNVNSLDGFRFQIGDGEVLITGFWFEEEAIAKLRAEWFWKGMVWQGALLQVIAGNPSESTMKPSKFPRIMVNTPERGSQHLNV